MRLALFLAMVLLAGGCSSFDRDYQAAVAQGISSDTVEGPWLGTWKSEAGHGGDELRALVAKAGPEAYRARFRAKFWGIFHTENEIDLQVTSSSPVRAGGQEDLGWLAGGLYDYQATLTPQNFTATYKSKYDHGDFRLVRPVR